MKRGKRGGEEEQMLEAYEASLYVALRYRESCRSSATYDLWLKAES